jgi:hypothetical protein
MRKTILIVLIVFLGKSSFLFSQEMEFVTFKHKALFLNIKYPSIWKNYWYYDNYSDKDYFDLSRNEIKEMVIKYGYYPVFYIKKYDEIYNGINPSVRITLQPHDSHKPDMRELIMALYNGKYETFIIYERIYRLIDVVMKILSIDKTITQEINMQYIGKEPVLHFKAEDYVLDLHIPDEKFNRTTEYFLYIEDDYIMVIEMNYSKTIDINGKNELMEIIKNIKLK